MALTKPRAYQIYDIDYKQATRAVTVANVTLTGGAPAVVDGVNLIARDRVLVTGQSDAKQNGIYAVSVVGSGSDGTWIRSDDTNSSGELLAGTIVMVTEGTGYADTQWKLITDDPIIIGTTELIFTQNYSANSISAGTSNVSVQSNANVTISSAGTANVVTVSNTGTYVTGLISATGNITGNYIIGNGSQLTGLPASYGNSNVSDYLASGTDTANIITTGNVSGNYILGNGSQLTGISVSSSRIFNGNSEANIGTTGGNANVSIGGVSNVAVFATTGLYITGEISANGNITAGGVRNLTSTTPPASPAVGDTWYDLSTDTIFRYVYDGTNYFWQDISGGSIVANVASAPAYANSNVVAYGESGWGGNIIPSANATYSLGNVTNQWKSLYVSNTTIYIGNVPLSTDGNVLSVAGNPVVVASSGDSIALTGNLSAQGNVTGNYIIGNGSQLTGLPAGYANSNAATFFASGTVATDIKTTALISATGNLIGNYIIGNGSTLTSVAGANITGTVANATYATSAGSAATATTATTATTAGTVTTNAQPNITSVGTLTAVTASGNVTGGNIGTAGQVSAAGAGYFGGGLFVTGNISASGNINYTNVNDLVVGDPLIYIGANNTADLVDLGIVGSANVSGIYQHLGLARNHNTGVWGLFGNVVAEPTTVIDWANAVYQPLLAGTVSSTGNITAAGLISATGNILGANLFISSTGNISGGNILAAGRLSATGNVTGNYILGNGALLTGVSTSSSNINNGTSNVTVVSSGGNVTVGIAGTANALVVTATGTSAVGNISAPQVIATNGLLVNSNVITGTFTLPANTNAISVGPILNAVGSNVTVPPGQRWIII